MMQDVKPLGGICVTVCAVVFNDEDCGLTILGAL